MNLPTIALQAVVLSILLALILACGSPSSSSPPVVWMEASETRYVDCFYDGYRRSVARSEADDYYWEAVDVFYECDLERPNRTYTKVADFVDCIEQAKTLWRSGYEGLNDEAIAVIEEEIDILYAKTLCWPENELRDLPDADEFIPETE